MNIFICRHGETLWNKSKKYQGQLNSELTDKGLLQAHKIGNFLLEHNIKHLYTTPLDRAVQTTKIVSEIIDVKYKIIENLKEIDFGLFQGSLRSTIKEEYADFFKNRSGHEVTTKYPNGESFIDVINRVDNINNELFKHKKNVAIIGHNFINKAIRGYLCNLSSEESYCLKQNNNDIVHYDLIKKSEILYTT